LVTGDWENPHSPKSAFGVETPTNFGEFFQSIFIRVQTAEKIYDKDFVKVIRPGYPHEIDVYEADGSDKGGLNSDLCNLLRA